MRNLKRVLSLALASVMLLGMMVIGAGAADKTYADLTDSDQISNTEAVALLVDLGIIQGKPDGSYAPTEIVDRATMAKLICTMIMGDIDQNLYKGTKTDLTDVDGHWAEGYIKYCYSNNIITGDGQGHFFPNEPVTVVQAAKMLLVALGYNAADRGYQNDANWSVNIMKDAMSTVNDSNKTVSLTNGISVKASDSLTRDNAAQMIFNTLFAKTVTPNYQWDMGNQYIQSYTPGSSLAATTFGGLTRFTGILTSAAPGATAITAPKSASGTTLTTSVTGLSASAADVGKNVAFYTRGDAANAPLVSSTVVGADSTVLYTDTLGNTVEAMVKTAATKQVEPEDASVATTFGITSFVVNGVAGKAVTDINALTAGSKIEYIDTDGNGKVDTVSGTSYTLSKVSNKVEAKGDTPAYLTITGVTGTSYNDAHAANKIEAKYAEGFDAVAKGDYVLYNESNGKIYLQPVTVVEGAMTSYNVSKSTVTVDGTVYGVSDQTVESVVSELTKVVNVYGTSYNYTTVDGTAAKFLLDANGYVLATTGIATAANYAVIMRVGVTTTSGDVMGNGAGKTVSMVVALPDGTVETLTAASSLVTEIYKTSGNTMVTDGNTGSGTTAFDHFFKDSDGAINSTWNIEPISTASQTPVLVTYSVNDKNEVTAVSAAGVTTTTSGFKAGNATIAANTAYIGSDTQVVIATVEVVNGVNTVVTKTYTGYSSLPTVADSSDITYVLKSGSTIADLVYVNAQPTSTAAKDMFYVLSADKEVGAKYTTISVAINGEKKALQIANGTSGLSSIATGEVYTYTVNSDGIVDTLSKVNAGSASTATLVTGKTVSIAESSYVVTNDTTALRYFASNVQVYDVSVAGEVSTGTLAAGDTISFVLENNTASAKILAVYITAHA